MRCSEGSPPCFPITGGARMTDVIRSSSVADEPPALPERPRHRAARCLARLRPALAARAVAELGAAEADAFLARLDLRFPDLHAPLEALYGGRDPAAPTAGTAAPGPDT